MRVVRLVGVGVAADSWWWRVKGGRFKLYIPPLSRREACEIKHHSWFHTAIVGRGMRGGGVNTEVVGSCLCCVFMMCCGLQMCKLWCAANKYTCKLHTIACTVAKHNTSWRDKEFFRCSFCAVMLASFWLGLEATHALAAFILRGGHNCIVCFTRCGETDETVMRLIAKRAPHRLKRGHAALQCKCPVSFWFFPYIADFPSLFLLVLALVLYLCCL